MSRTLRYKSEAEFLASVAKRGGDPRTALPKTKPSAANAKLVDLVYESEDPKSKSEIATGSVEQSRIISSATPGVRFEATFLGARLLTLNDLLRIDMREMNPYRKAWHTQALNAFLLCGHPRMKFENPIRLTLIRRGIKLVDNDGLAASFKFAIDGFKEAGLIKDDNPTIVETIDLVQSTGSYAAALLFEDVALPVNRPYARSLIERKIP